MLAINDMVEISLVKSAIRSLTTPLLRNDAIHLPVPAYLDPVHRGPNDFADTVYDDPSYVT